MPPKARKTGHTDQEAQQLRRLISIWKIDFESVPTLDDWDARHFPSKHLFEQILEIKAVTFVGYPRDEHPHKHIALQKKLLVRKLQANAARCRREKDNEAGWINNVANLVFEGLNGFEFQCQVCDAYRWLPDFVARPKDGVAAESLFQDYRTRKICKCSAIRRAAHVRVNRDSPSLFSNKSDEWVVHNSTGLKNVTLDQKYQRPDRVYGLSVTDSFDDFTDRLREFSPFSEGHTLFPFMVVEAKSDKSKDGFHSIEQQTALSIRTCLRIQQALEGESNQVLDPVVWFFAFRGDEWRLYMALPVHDRTKIIDCWHGCISVSDEALQLLLIVDWICFWARDVLLVAVLKCLYGLEAGELTPAPTGFSSQGETDAGRGTTRSSSLVFRSSRPLASCPQGNAQHKIDSPVNDPYEPEDEDMHDAIGDDGLDREHSEGSSTTVRSAHDIVSRWKSFALPDEDSAMLECLSSIADSNDIRDAAKALWEMLTDNSIIVKMSLKSIADLVHNPTDQESTELAAGEPVATFLACQYRLTETSWQIMCTYWCFTCTLPAAHLLAKIAGVTDGEVFSLNFWAPHDCDCLVSAVADFRELSGRQTATAAISQEIYCVRARNSGPNAGHVEWYKGDRNIVQPKVAMLEALFRHFESAQQTNLPDAALRIAGRDSKMSAGLFATGGLDEVPGVILKKPDMWPVTCPSWCFLTFEHGGRETVGRQIELALQRKAVYTVGRAGALDHSDEQAISEWAVATKDVMQSIDAS